MTTDPGPHANHHNQPVKKTQESTKTQREKTPRSEDKSVSKTKTPKENTIPSVRAASVPAHVIRLLYLFFMLHIYLVLEVEKKTKFNK